MTGTAESRCRKATSPGPTRTVTPASATPARLTIAGIPCQGTSPAWPAVRPSRAVRRATTACNASPGTLPTSTSASRAPSAP